MWKIAKRKLNNEFLWEKIAELNNLGSPSLIYPYQKLIIPIEKPENVLEENNNTGISSVDEVKSILEKYQVKYVFVGDKEYEKYPEINSQKFKEIGAKIVFQSGKTVVYQL